MNLLEDQNPHWDSIEMFIKTDKHLRDLAKAKWVYDFGLADNLKESGVYLIYGARQVGKTTALKMFLRDTLNAGTFSAKNSAYLNCDSILERDELYRIILNFYKSIRTEEKSLLILDEVTTIKRWELSVKAIIDLGLTSNSTVIITGSDRIILEDAAAGFPGIDRRGKFGKDITISPLGFSQFAKLLGFNCRSREIENNNDDFKKANELFQTYLITGGYLSAINNLQVDQVLPHQLLEVYKQWISSDFFRKGKDRNKLLDLLKVIYHRQGSQLSYTKISQEAVSLSPETSIDYISHLERLGVMTVLGAFDQNSLSAFPKKSKKFHFRDPLISHVVKYWLASTGQISNDECAEESELVEAVVVAAHLDRGSLYYIKAEGEVDLVVVRDGGFTPIEVKWSDSLKKNELSQILKYKNGLILSKLQKSGTFGEVRCKNILGYLLDLSS